MKEDTLVFDIETSNFFTDPGVGWNNFGALNISVVGVYSYVENKYYCYEESEMEELAVLFRNAKIIVGFASNRYDVPVLHRYFQKLFQEDGLDLWAKERVDLLEEIENITKKRISLSRLAELNLGVKKGMHGSKAIQLFEEGRMDELKEYCLNDVKLTKELYDIYLDKKEFTVWDHVTGEVGQVHFA